MTNSGLGVELLPVALARQQRHVRAHFGRVILKYLDFSAPCGRPDPLSTSAGLRIDDHTTAARNLTIRSGSDCRLQ